MPLHQSFAMATPIAALKRNIHLSHAKQLAHLQLLPAPDSRKEDPPPSLLQTITGWIQDNAQAIKAAQNSREYPCPIGMGSD